MDIYIATDHAGFELKELLKGYIQDTLGHQIHDCGAVAYDPEDDYPVFIKEAALKVSTSKGKDRAIILGGSGTGEAIVANRFPHVRAAVFYGGPTDIVRLSREHNDANVLSLGARFLTYEQVCEAVRLWLETSFSGDERHERRIAQIDA